MEKSTISLLYLQRCARRTWRHPNGQFRFDAKQNIVHDFYLGKVVEKDGTFTIEQGEKIASRVDQYGVQQ